MILIVYGKDDSIFETKIGSVPGAIEALYEFVEGDIDTDLFWKAVEGLNMVGSIADIVDLYNKVACEPPIKAIYTQAQPYWKPMEYAT